jgi:small-conductance mechanosensitive channel
MFTALIIVVIVLGILFGYAHFFLPLTTGYASIKPYADMYLPIADKIAIGIVSAIALILLLSITKKIFKRISKLSFFRDPLARKLFPLIERATFIFVFVIGLIFALNMVGVDVSALIAGAGVGGIFLGLAGKEAASNLFGSISLIVGGMFHIGDVIRVKTYEGRVEEITLSYTKLATKDDTVIYIPNKNIVTEAIENMGDGKLKKFDVVFDVPNTLSSAKTKLFLTEIETELGRVSKERKFKRYRVVYESFNDRVQRIIANIEMVGGSKTEIKRELFLFVKEKIEDYEHPKSEK